MDKLKIQREEVLRYLGYRNQNIDEELIRKIDKIRRESIVVFRPKNIFSLHKIEIQDKKIFVDKTNLIIQSNDMFNLLKDSDRIYLLAVTLGNDIERLTRKYEKISMMDAVILDACATTAIEEYCDNLEKDLEKELKEGESFTFRYSPGYGDLSLDIQNDLVNILNCERTIGLKVSEHKLLFPRKSVTAILGVTKGEKTRKSCLNCSNYDNCIYKREGDICGCS